MLLAQSNYDLKKQSDIINVKIIKEYSTDLPDINCVGMEIEQVLLNLIKNGVQAMAGEETTERCLILRTLKADEAVRIEVEDNGPGIDTETKKQIFNPFFTTKEVGSGTGLCLSVSYAIICEKHHGKIWVESRLPQAFGSAPNSWHMQHSVNKCHVKFDVFTKLLNNILRIFKNFSKRSVFFFIGILYLPKLNWQNFIRIIKNSQK